VALHGASPRNASASEAPTWTLLPPLPDRATTDVDGVVALGGPLPTVAVINRGPDSATVSTVITWQWNQGQWTRAAETPLTIDRNQQAFAAGGSCIAAPVHQQATVWCLTNGAWQRSGRHLFDVDADSITRPTLSAYSADGSPQTAARVAAATATAATGDATIKGRPRATSFVRTDRGAWEYAGPIASTRDAPGGSLRPFAFSLSGSQCYVATLLGRSAKRSPTIGGSCRSSRDSARVRWFPPLRVSRAAGKLAAANRVALNSDGAVGRDRDAFVGVDVFEGPSTSWQVWRLRGRTWRRTELSVTPPGWNSQGSLYRVGQLVLALRFDQQGDLSTGLRSRITVRGLTEDSRVGNVGSPLVDGTARAPLYWDLAAGPDQVFAAATSPNATTGRNDVRVWTTPRADLERASKRW
jgi:hypothetical protein